MTRGVYILPSFITVINLCVGMTSIFFAIEDRLVGAAWAIIVGIVCDMMDGRIARLTRTSSHFGLELDSLSDLVTFGVAPAVLMYQVALVHLGRVGLVLAIFFTTAGALRLARYNVRAYDVEHPPKPYFEGLPIPAAAGILSAFVLSYELFETSPLSMKTIPLLMDRMPMFYKAIPLVMVLLSFLMLSNVRYSKFHGLKLGRPKSLATFGVFLVSCFAVAAYPQNTIFIIFMAYVASGIIGYAALYIQLRRERRLQEGAE